jgi:hypothetical protein
MFQPCGVIGTGLNPLLQGHEDAFGVLIALTSQLCPARKGVPLAIFVFALLWIVMEAPYLKPAKWSNFGRLPVGKKHFKQHSLRPSANQLLSSFVPLDLVCQCLDRQFVLWWCKRRWLQRLQWLCWL